jgi:hypothetical protein
MTTIDMHAMKIAKNRAHTAPDDERDGDDAQQDSRRNVDPSPTGGVEPVHVIRSDDEGLVVDERLNSLKNRQHGGGEQQRTGGNRCTGPATTWRTGRSLCSGSSVILAS